MHSSIFIISDEPYSRDFNFDLDEFESRVMYERGYDYWTDSENEEEISKSITGYWEEFFKVERLEEKIGAPDDEGDLYKLTIINREKFLRNLFEEYQKAVEELREGLTWERFSDSGDIEVENLQENVTAIMDNKFGMQFIAIYMDLRVRNH